jgi:hypothetical protein
MRERLSAGLKALPAQAVAWGGGAAAAPAAAAPLPPSPFAATAARQLQVLAGALGPLLSHEELHSIFGRIAAMFARTLAEAFDLLEPHGPPWERQLRADVEVGWGVELAASRILWKSMGGPWAHLHHCFESCPQLARAAAGASGILFVWPACWSAHAMFHVLKKWHLLYACVGDRALAVHVPPWLPGAAVPAQLPAQPARQPRRARQRRGPAHPVLRTALLGGARSQSSISSSDNSSQSAAAGSIPAAGWRCGAAAA